LQVTVCRDGQVATLAFSGGDVIESLVVRERTGSDRRQGTTVRVWPDAKYFEGADLPRQELVHLLRSKAVLMPGVTVTLTVEKAAAKDAQNPPNPRDVETQTWLYKGGLRDYLTQGLAADPIIPLFEGEQYASGAESDNVAEGEGAAWCVAFTDDGHTLRESYVNLIPTVAGGTHESGLKDGFFQAVKGFIELHSLMPKGVKLMPEDVFSRASFVLSAKVLDPQFQGQIKERLNSRDALRLVSNYVKPALELWLNQHVEHGKKLAELVIRQAQTRQRAGQKVEKRKGSGVAVLPGKLTDCESRDTTLNEVFLVEGDSAGGSAKMGRDKETQAILPLRGKVLNAWEVERDRLFANTEIHDIAVAVGVDPHGPGDEPDFSGLRYGKVCILSDADVDGSHIQVLLLTLFFRHFPKLIERGHVYVAKPPLFRVDAPARGRKPLAKIYALDEGELQATLDKLRKEGLREGAWSISRFKGLGEMSAEQLWETTLNPETRRLLQVGFGASGVAAVTQSLTRLMGKGEAAARRELMELHGDSVEVDV
jgi:topoisomerase-4 subunit B